MESNNNKLMTLNSENVEIIGTTTNVILANQTRVQKATAKGNEIIGVIEKDGMSEDYDQLCNLYLSKVNKTVKTMKDERSKITSIFNLVTKEFTSLEKQLDKTSSFYQKIQTFRNDFARKKAEEEKERQKAAQLKLDQDNERVSIKASIEQMIEDKFSIFVSESQNSLVDSYNDSTLDNIDELLKFMNDFKVDYNPVHLHEMEINIRSIYIDAKELVSIVDQIKTDKLSDLDQRYWCSVDDTRINLIESIPAHKQELKQLAELATSDAKKAEELKAEQAKRESARKKELEAKAAAEKLKQKEKIEATSNAAKMNNMFAAESSAQVKTESKAQVRTTWKITITHQKGYAEIFALYFQKEGANATIDELSRKTLGSMVKYCEKLAKDGERIESKYIKYTEDYSAVNKA